MPGPTGGLALGRTIRGRWPARRTARRPLGKIACRPEGALTTAFAMLIFAVAAYMLVRSLNLI